MREGEPVPQEMGQLVPPSRRPPTAVGAATPNPDDERHRAAFTRQDALESLVAAARRVLIPLFDVADALADRIVATVRDLGSRTARRT